MTAPVDRDVQAAQSTAGDGIEEGPGSIARLGYLIDGGEELRGHLGCPQASTGQAERANPACDEHLPLRSPIANTLILHQDWPTSSSYQGEPLDIGHGLVSRDAVDLGECVHSEPRGPKQRGHLASPEAPVEEQVGQPGRVPRHSSGRDANRHPHGILEVG